MRAYELFETRRPYVAEHAANEAVLKSTGQRFYSGAFDPLDGHILEIHSWEEAFDADHHHSHYFSQRMIEKMRLEEANFFWFARFQLHTMWRQGEAPPNIKAAKLSYRPFVQRFRVAVGEWSLTTMIGAEDGAVEIPYT